MFPSFLYQGKEYRSRKSNFDLDVEETHPYRLVQQTTCMRRVTSIDLFSGEASTKDR